MDYEKLLTVIENKRKEISTFFDEIAIRQEQIATIKADAKTMLAVDIEGLKDRIKELKQVRREIEVA